MSENYSAEEIENFKQIFDIFDKNVDINQYANKNYVERSNANTLSRYFMLSLTYNMKGFETKLQKNRFW